MLRNICDEIKADEKHILEIDQLQIVIFQCRSLEKRLLTYPIRMESALNAMDNIPEWHLKEVHAIIDQFLTDNLVCIGKIYFVTETEKAITEQLIQKQHLYMTFLTSLRFMAQ